MSKLLRFLLSFCVFYAVDPADGGGDAETEKVDEASDNTETPVSAGEAAWDAIQTTDDEEPVDKPEGEQPEKTEQATTQEAEQTPEQKAAAEAAKKEITDDDLKPLEGAKQSTQERFQKVTAGYKEQRERADKLESENSRYKESFDSLRQLGFTDAESAEDLLNFSEYRKILASGNEAQFADVINQQIKQFQALHGKSVQIGGSLIDDYPDLQQKLKALEIDEPTALEAARHRKLQERASRETQQRQQHQQSAEQHQAMINESADKVDALEKNWRATDPDYASVMSHLKEMLPDIWKLPASQWVSTVEMQYKAIKKALAAGTTQRQPSSLRGNGQMNGTRQHNSMQDAVLDAMGMSE